jgi:hypothetical protein
MIETLADSATNSVARAIDRPTIFWAPATRVAFRFCFLYFGLYVVTTQMLNGLLVIPRVGFPPLETLPPLRNVIAWTALHAFRVTHPLVITGSGSGDKTANWVAAFCLLVASGLGTLVWSLIDRQRAGYPALDRWFRLFMRFAVGTTMLGYGMVKAFPMQMPYPPLTRLLEPFGNFSPMGVLWYSVGASPGWERFVGVMELTAGVLLFIPRLSLLGAMVCFADAVQIFTLNMTYDVPVKLFSFHLILMSVFLMAPEIPRLFRALLTRVPGGKVLVAGQIVLATYYVGTQIYQANQSWHRFGGGAPHPALYGIWNVDRMFIGGVERSPLVTDYDRWRRVVIQNATTVYFQRMDETLVIYPAKFDDKANTIVLTKPSDKNWKATFGVRRPDLTHLTLTGAIDGRPIELRTTLLDRAGFQLVNRGFNWVQEFPVNR